MEFPCFFSSTFGLKRITNVWQTRQFMAAEVCRRPLPTLLKRAASIFIGVGDGGISGPNTVG